MFVLNSSLALLLTIMLSLAFSTAPEAATIIAPGDSNNPPDSINIVDYQGEWAQGMGDNAYYGCVVSVWVPVPGGKWQYYAKYNSWTTCWGVPIIRAMTQEKRYEQARKIALAAGNLRVNYKLVGGNKDCTTQVWWGIKGAGGEQVTAPCTPISVPATCTADTPPALEHPAKNTGLIRSTQRATMHLRCDRRTSVTVSVPEADLVLRKGESTIATKFFIGEHGQTSTNLTVANEGIVSLLSVIDSQGGDVGTYIGSVVVNVTWD